MSKKEKGRVRKFAKAIQKAFATKIDEPIEDQIDFDDKHQRRFKGEYDTAIEIIVSIKDGAALAALMAEYLVLYFAYEKKLPNNVHFHRSDQTFFEMFDRSTRVATHARDPFEDWVDALVAPFQPLAPFNPIRQRYDALNQTYRSAIDAVVRRERAARRSKKSGLDLLRDAYVRTHGRVASSVEELHGFDPYESPTLDAKLSSRVSAVKDAWAACLKEDAKEHHQALDDSVDAAIAFFRATGKSDGMLALFHVIKTLGDRIRKKRLVIGSATAVMAGDDDVVTVELYCIVCLALLEIARVDEALKKNRYGFTEEEVRFFMSPIDDSFYRYKSNARNRLDEVTERAKESMAFTKGFLSLVLIGAHLKGGDVQTLVELDETMAIQKKWHEIHVLSSKLDQASEREQTRLLSDAGNLRVLGNLLDIMQMSVDVRTGPDLGQGVVRPGSSPGGHRELGAMTVVYIDPKNPEAVYVEFAKVRPHLFRVRPAYIADKLYASRIMTVHASTVGMMYVTQALFAAMGFLPVLVEAGFAAMLYEVAVFFASIEVEELASKVDPKLGKVLGLLTQLVAPRPRFGPKLSAGAASEGKAVLVVEETASRGFSEALASTRAEAKLVGELDKGTIRGAVAKARDAVRDKAMALELGNAAERFEVAPAMATNEGVILRTGGDARRVGVRGGGRSGGGRAGRDASMSRAEKSLRATPQAKLLTEYLPLLEDDAARLAHKETVKIYNDLRTGKIGYSEAKQEITNLLNAAKESTGEYVADGLVFSNFDVLDVVSIPRRTNGVPMLDRVYEVRNPATRNVEYLFVEVKGGTQTRLGWVTKKEYTVKNGTLHVTTVEGQVTQASPEWYFQKMVEIYDSGQEGLARKLFAAARAGKVQSAVVKSGVSMDPRVVFHTEEFVSWFAKKKLPWD